MRSRRRLKVAPVVAAPTSGLAAVAGHRGHFEAIGKAISHVRQGNGTPTAVLSAATRKADQALAER